jgi:hypothetical protein
VGRLPAEPHLGVQLPQHQLPVCSPSSSTLRRRCHAHGFKEAQRFQRQQVWQLFSPALIKAPGLCQSGLHTCQPGKQVWLRCRAHAGSCSHCIARMHPLHAHSPERTCMADGVSVPPAFKFRQVSKHLRHTDVEDCGGQTNLAAGLLPLRRRLGTRGRCETGALGLKPPTRQRAG